MLDSIFRMCISGPSSCGKSTLLFALLDKRAELIKPPPRNIYFFYGVKQKVFSNYPYIKFIEGLPNIEHFSDDDLDQSIIIIDDQMEFIDQKVVSLYTKYSHHKNFSAVFLTQSFYYRGNKFIRDLTLNCSILIIFDNPRDRTIITNLSKQLYPGNSRFLTSVFRKVTETPYAYICIDLRIGVPEACRIRTRILDDNPSAFVPLDFNIKKWNERKV
jgi:hypothetical protein